MKLTFHAGVHEWPCCAPAMFITTTNTRLADNEYKSFLLTDQDPVPARKGWQHGHCLCLLLIQCLRFLLRFVRRTQCYYHYNHMNGQLHEWKLVRVMVTLTITTMLCLLLLQSLWLLLRHVYVYYYYNVYDFYYVLLGALNVYYHYNHMNGHLLMRNLDRVRVTLTISSMLCLLLLQSLITTTFRWDSKCLLLHHCMNSRLLIRNFTLGWTRSKPHLCEYGSLVMFVSFHD